MGRITIKTREVYKDRCQFAFSVSVLMILFFLINSFLLGIHWKDLVVFLPYFIIMLVLYMCKKFNNIFALEYLSYYLPLTLYFLIVILICLLVKIINERYITSAIATDYLITIVSIVIATLTIFVSLIVLFLAIKEEKKNVTMSEKINKMLDEENMSEDKKDFYKSYISNDKQHKYSKYNMNSRR